MCRSPSRNHLTEPLSPPRGQSSTGIESMQAYAVVRASDGDELSDTPSDGALVLEPIPSLIMEYAPALWLYRSLVGISTHHPRSFGRPFPTPDSHCVKRMPVPHGHAEPGYEQRSCTVARTLFVRLHLPDGAAPRCSTLLLRREGASVVIHALREAQE